jgi:predicted small secreted protein
MKNWKLFGFNLLIITAVLLSGCQNTVQGFGKDMQRNGEKLQQSMDDQNSTNK